MPDFEFETRLWEEDFKIVAGADEVGRGAWAGPVVATAVAFAPISNFQFLISKQTPKINDSKKLTRLQRERADAWIRVNCLAWGIGEVGAVIINRIGLAKATRMAFRRAIVDCNRRSTLKVDFLLIDAFYLPYTKGLRRRNQKAIIRGDSKSFSIAAASIIAKVYRDRLMSELSKKHKVYAWDYNKGYGTQEHQAAILKHGLTRLHRKITQRHVF